MKHFDLEELIVIRHLIIDEIFKPYESDDIEYITFLTVLCKKITEMIEKEKNKEK